MFEFVVFTCRRVSEGEVGLARLWVQSVDSPSYITHTFSDPVSEVSGETLREGDRIGLHTEGLTLYRCKLGTTHECYPFRNKM